MDRQPAEAGPPATGVREPDVPGRTSSVIQDMQLSLLGKESSASLQFVNSARDRISSLPKEEQITFPDLNLPAIVVIGGQNAGKSTVLERLMGLDAIPRGAAGRRSDSMSSTKCPIETRLVRAVDGKERCEVKFNNKKHTGPLSILPGVLRDLNKEAAKLASARDAQVDIYDEPIIVTIHSHAVIEELTFIDLPGIIITDEEKTKGNASRTLALAKKHCLDKSKIILLVMNATVDLSQVPGITTLREVQESNTDEEVWRRTIGVYTKLDTLIDSAKTDTGSKLFLDAIAARVKRPGQQTHMSQSFLLSNMNIDHTSFNGKKTWSNKDEEVKELECLDRKNWPENSDSSYNAVAGSCGVAALRSALSRVLAMRVEQGLKSIREKLESHLAKISLELEKLPPAIEESRKGVELSIKLQELCKSLTSRSGREIKLSVIEVADLSEPARHLKKIRETFFTEITKLSMPFFTAEGFNNSFQIIWKEASAEHASQDPGQLVLSPFGRIKVMGKFLEPMRRRAIDLCNEVRETVCSKIVKASIEAVFAAYPDLIKEVTKILLDDTGCSLWERQAALANAEVQAHLDSLCQLFDSASDIEHEKNVLQHHIDNLQLKAKLNDTVFEMSAQLMLRVKSIKSVIFRILYMRLLEDPLMTIESSVANLQSKNDLQNGEICVWQQNLFGTQLSRATRDALSKIPQESLHALPKALKKFLATADRWDTLCMAFRQDKGVEIKRSKLLHQQDTAKELLDGWHRIHNARI